MANSPRTMDRGTAGRFRQPGAVARHRRPDVSRQRLGCADDAVIGFEPSVEVELLRAVLKAPLDFHFRELPRFGGDRPDLRRGIGPRRKVCAVSGGLSSGLPSARKKYALGAISALWPTSSDRPPAPASDDSAARALLEVCPMTSDARITASPARMVSAFANHRNVLDECTTS